MLSSLQLKHAVFSEISLTANPDPQPESRIRLLPTISAGHHVDDVYDWRIELAVRFGTEPEDGLPYSGSFVVVGFFRLNDSCPQEDLQAMATINGASLLYGMIREMVSNLSARAANGPFLLPTLDFRKVVVPSDATP